MEAFSGLVQVFTFKKKTSQSFTCGQKKYIFTIILQFPSSVKPPPKMAKKNGRKWFDMQENDKDWTFFWANIDFDGILSQGNLFNFFDEKHG